MSWIGVITNAGTAMLAQWTLGGHTLTIDKATVGSGIRSEINLRTATALVAEQANASIVSAKEVTSGTQFRIRVSPAAVTAYTAHEIGIWGHLDNDEDLTLIAIHQDADTGIEVPTAAEMPSFQFDLYCLHAIGNDGTLNITLTEQVYPTVDEMEAAISVIQDEIDAINTSILNTLAKMATVEEDSSSLSKGYKAGEYCIADGKLYRFIKRVFYGDAIITGTGTSADNAVETTITKELSTDKLWFYSVPVEPTTGLIVDIIDSRITKQHVLSEIVWTDQSKITALTQWSTETEGHFTISGTCSSATTANILLVRANVMEDLSD